ncbi:MAG: sulfite exporter TauE/SafE family protein [Candidatus Omnitrophica bacterium]|nr:sulfite exporter TauE/SafE family protein [Candidatus Omnitrophota bacterium]
MKSYVSIFLLGLSFGWGPCLASCGPLFLSYVAATRKNIFQGTFSYILFSFSRVLVYSVLGLLVFFLGRFILERLINFFKISLILGGVFVILLAILIVLGKDITSIPCKFLQKHILEKDNKSLILLGVVSALLPCAPLISVLTYAGLIAKNALDNFIYVLAFGLGTILSPLILLVGFAGLIPRVINSSKAIYMRIFNLVCSLIMIILGIQLIRRAF